MPSIDPYFYPRPSEPPAPATPVRPFLSIVVPMYNEAENITEFLNTISEVLKPLKREYEVIAVNDGSTDATLALLKNAIQIHRNLKIVDLSRNFGKEAALTAGIDYANGEAVVPIDADLQDPPELILDMVEHWQSGADVVLARRVDRGLDSLAKRVTSRWFYRLFAKIAKPGIPDNVGDFRLMDRRVVDALKSLPERSRFMKGLFAWVGFHQVTID